MQNKNNLGKESGVINVGILGCANIAKKYAIEAFKSIKKVDKIFIASRDIEKAKKWAADFNIDFKNSYEDIVNDKSIDAVYIPLPVNMHEEWAIKCAKKNKNVICEKSLASDFDAVKKMVETFNKEGLVLFENFACEYHPQHSKVLSLIKNGEIGTPLVFGSYFGFQIPEGNIRKDEKLDTGSLNDIGAYLVYMSRKIFGEEPISAVADFDQNQGALYMKFPGNKEAFGGFGLNHAYQNNYSVWGSTGLIEVKKAYSIAPKINAPISIFKAKPEGDTLEQIEVENANQFELIFRDFCKTILEKNDKKRLEKYDAILFQARVMQALRIAKESDSKVFLNKLNL